MTTTTLPRRANRVTRTEYCTGCGHRGRTESSGDYQCTACRPRGTYRPTADYGLTGGRWVRHGLIWHWHPNPTTPVQEETA